MSVKIFVGNLPFSVDDERLKAEFTKFGTVESARVVTDRHTGRSRGYGFVEFADTESANAAIEQMAGQSLDGRALTVNMAKTQTND